MIDGIDEECQGSEFREFREFKELRERLSLNSLNSLNSLIHHLNQRDRFLVRRVADATLGKNPDDGLYKKYRSLSGLFLLAAADAPLSREIISCQKS